MADLGCVIRDQSGTNSTEASYIEGFPIAVEEHIYTEVSLHVLWPDSKLDGYLTGSDHGEGYCGSTSWISKAHGCLGSLHTVKRDKTETGKRLGTKRGEAASGSWSSHNASRCLVAAAGAAVGTD